MNVFIFNQALIRLRGVPILGITSTATLQSLRLGLVPNSRAIIPSPLVVSFGLNDQKSQRLVTRAVAC